MLILMRLVKCVGNIKCFEYQNFHDPQRSTSIYPLGVTDSLLKTRESVAKKLVVNNN